VYGAALRLTFSEIDLRKWVENRKRKADAKKAELEATFAGIAAQMLDKMAKILNKHDIKSD